MATVHHLSIVEREQRGVIILAPHAVLVVEISFDTNAKMKLRWLDDPPPVPPVRSDEQSLIVGCRALTMLLQWFNFNRFEVSPYPREEPVRPLYFELSHRTGAVQQSSAGPIGDICELISDHARRSMTQRAWDLARNDVLASRN